MPLVVSVEAHLSVKSPARKDQTGYVCYLAAVALRHKVVQTNVAHKREAKIMITTTKKKPCCFFSQYLQPGNSFPKASACGQKAKKNICQKKNSHTRVVKASV